LYAYLISPSMPWFPFRTQANSKVMKAGQYPLALPGT